jgi:hypothetical protein
MMPTKPIKPLAATAAAVPNVADDECTYATHVDAQACRLLVAERQHVEDTPVHDQHSRARADVRQHQQHVVPARGVEVAEDPGVDRLQRVGVLLLDERLRRGEKCRNRHARQDERGRTATLPRSRTAERIGRGDG